MHSPSACMTITCPNSGRITKLPDRRGAWSAGSGAGAHYVTSWILLWDRGATGLLHSPAASYGGRCLSGYGPDSYDIGTPEAIKPQVNPTYLLYRHDT